MTVQVEREVLARRDGDAGVQIRQQTDGIAGLCRDIGRAVALIIGGVAAADDAGARLDIDVALEVIKLLVQRLGEVSIDIVAGDVHIVHVQRIPGADDFAVHDQVDRHHVCVSCPDIVRDVHDTVAVHVLIIARIDGVTVGIREGDRAFRDHKLARIQDRALDGRGADMGSVRGRAVVVIVLVENDVRAVGRVIHIRTGAEKDVIGIRRGIRAGGSRPAIGGVDVAVAGERAVHTQLRAGVGGARDAALHDRTGG